MYSSPKQLRSGHKGQRVLLSVTANSISLSPTTDMPGPADKPSKAIDLSVIDECVNKHLSSGDFVSSLVGRMKADLRTIVEDAVRSALSDVTKEVTRLGAEVARLSTALGQLESRLLEKTDDLEQYNRRNNLRIFGIEESAKEDTDSIVVDLCRGKLGLSEVTVDALCRSHRVGKPPKPGPNGEKRHRPIIVRFTNYRERRKVFEAKKKLKGSGIVIREDLTATRLELLRRATAVHGVRSTWTQDGRVMWTDKDGGRGVAVRLNDLPPIRIK